MIAAIMPCRGRPEQTLANVRRLLASAGQVEWRLFLAGGEDDIAVIWHTISQADIAMEAVSYVASTKPHLSYWEALAMASRQTDAPLLVSLANDLWGCDGWLEEALAEYRHHFGVGDGLLGFSGDGHGWSHSCHFLISRGLLDRYGGWPVWYQHNFGDTELCARARADGCYWKSLTATLEHCHVGRGLAPDDAVYQAGRQTYHQDEALFVARRAAGWPHV